MRNNVTKNIVLIIIFLVEMHFRDVCLSLKSLCHCLFGNYRAQQRVLILDKVLEQLGLKPER